MDQAIETVTAAICFIEDHLTEKLDLERVARAVHYSKYHLHRIFTGAVGLRVHEYVQRRKLTEAAKLLVCSDKPMIEIALLCGYESQQAFTTAFKSMYKTPPAQYRFNRKFYPLQLRFTLYRERVDPDMTGESIRLAGPGDIPAWMELMHLVIDGYPVMDEAEYLARLKTCIEERRALVLREGDRLIGAMAFTREPGSILFWGVHPQYRNCGIQRLFLDALLEKYLSGREISTTTYREGDRADTGHRAALKQLGFAERELLTELGYPTQRFTLPPRIQEESVNG